MTPPLSRSFGTAKTTPYDLDVATIANDIPEQPDDNRQDANHSSAKDSPLSMVTACVSVNTCPAIICVFTKLATTQPRHLSLSLIKLR